MTLLNNIFKDTHLKSMQSTINGVFDNVSSGGAASSESQSKEANILTWASELGSVMSSMLSSLLLDLIEVSSQIFFCKLQET